MSDEKIKEIDTVKESFERFRTIIENAPVGYYRVGKDGLWQYVNPEWERMHGFSLQEVMGKSFEMTQPDDAKETARQYVKRCLAGETMRGEFVRTRKDGTLEYHTFNIQPVYQKGEIVAIEGFINDITERKLAEQKLEESEIKYRTLSDYSMVGISIIQDMQFKYVNQKFADNFGYTKEELLNFEPNDLYTKLIHAEDLEKAISISQINQEGGNPEAPDHLEIRCINKDGGSLWLDVFARSIQYEGRDAGMNVSIDITERKNIEQKLKKSEANLRKLNIELEQKVQERTRNLEKSEEKYREAYNLVNFYKDLFTHDMNNILQNIISSAEFYSMFRNEPETLKKLGDISEVVIKHARRGSELISNVRKLSKLGETDTQLNIIEILDILHQSVEHTVSGFQERNVKIDIKGLSKDMKLLGNELLVDIFDNILNNAVKYNDNEKEVKVDVNVSKIQEDGINYIKFEFKDYGIGIIDEKKDDLFERQYTDDISERGMGMGMGLSLVKMIVDKYGGKLLVEDRVKGDYSKGSNFIVLLKEAQ